MEILIVINSRHQLHPSIADFLERLSNDSEFKLIIERTGYKGHTIDIIANFNRNIGLILLIGGDGTFNEGVNGYMKGGHTAPLGLVPNGTGNDFIRMFKPFVANEFIEQIKSRRYVKVDLGLLKSDLEERYFVNIAGVGIDGKVIEIMDRSIEGKESRLTYAKAILKAFLSYRRPTLRISGDDFNFEGETLMVAMCNGRVFGNGLVISPYASLVDSRINITLLGKVSLFDYIRNMGKLKKGKAIQHKEVHYYSTSTLNIAREQGELYSEIDGEHFRGNNLIMSIIPGAIPLINELIESDERNG